MSSVNDFHRICAVDLNNYDSEKKQFNIDLDNEIQEVLAVGVSFYWISFKTLDAKALKNVMNSKDYSYYSPANLLKEVQTLRNTIRDEYYSKMRRYSYDINDVSTLIT